MICLVTGSAGFIGFHVAKTLLKRGDRVIGIDNMNNYYDPKLKEDRCAILRGAEDFTFYKMDLCDREGLETVFKEHKIDKVCHLAAQAGVRYSLIDPFVYQRSNLEGFLNILHLSKEYGVKNFVFASSSSVYGNNQKVPFSETDPVDHPISLYAATKKAGELMAHTYHHLYKLPCVGLRFFTVYGPYGRPDMALFKFTKNIIEDKEIEVYNFGNMRRDFTYIDDIVQGVVPALDREFAFEIINLGNNRPVALDHFISCIEHELGKSAKKKMLPLQAGDVVETYADIDKAKRLLGFEPKTTVDEGVKRFVAWYKEYYKVCLEQPRHEGSR